jgi:hypothetical protein
VCQKVILKEHRHTFLSPFSPAWLIAVHIVPAILIKRVAHQGRAHHEYHLTLGHAGSQLIDHFLRDDVALLDVDLVHAGKLQTGKAASAEKERTAEQQAQAKGFVPGERRGVGWRVAWLHEGVSFQGCE